MFQQRCYFFTNARIGDPGETRLPLCLRQRVKLVEVMLNSAPMFAPGMQFLGLAIDWAGEQRRR